MKKFLPAIIILFLFVCCNKSYDSDYAKLVNPLIGTDFHGHTYPGAVAPFGMIQLSPDSRIGQTWDGCSGYHYSDDVIYGFTHTHLNGTGCFDLCDILFMPTVGKLNFSNDISNGTVNSYVSKFNHNNEHAEAGYYSVVLDDYNIKAELTATERVGYHKYSFPQNDSCNVIIDLNHQDPVITSSVNIISDSELTGERRSSYWASDQKVFFYAVFSEPFHNSGILFNDSLVNASSVEGNNVKAFVTFNNLKSPVYIKVGISAVSIKNAKENIDGSPDFDVALSETQQKWNEELSKIKVKSLNIDDQVVFYTALYHTMIAPNLFSDVNGEYRGRDFNTYSADSKYYTVFSLWDTYRALHPLHSFINQNITNDFVNTMLLQYQHGGRLPVWELSANETDCMIGYHSIPVIYDAYVKGIRDFDTKLALKAMVHSADLDHFGLESYKANGFISSEIEHESVSKTLEYAYDDWCIAMFAKSLGVDSIYNRFIKRAQNYKNIFDNKTGFCRAKINNMWFSPFDPKEVNFNYTEANCWQYTFSVPQDVNTFINMLGGDDTFATKLDQLFSESSEMTGREQSDITGVIGQFALGNEPSHHISYLYNYVGQPYKTQKLSRQIMKDMFFNKPDGICGNDDCGQMSAWYVFSALGFYPVCPGDKQLILGSPRVVEADITLENGRHFVIKTENQSESNIYVDKVLLNDMEYTKSFITYSDILNGGTLIYYMSNEPNKSYGKEIVDRPVNQIKEHLINPVPVFSAETATFNDNATIGIEVTVPNCDIYYTVDGTTPTKAAIKYTEPIVINETTNIKAVSYNSDSVPSNVISTVFTKIPKYREISLQSSYENQYSAGGVNALVDFVRGGINFRTGGWQGYQGQDIEAVIDLGKTQNIKTIGMGFLQNVKSWIFYPTEVQYYVSDDGEKFVEFGKVVNEVSGTNMEVTIQDFVSSGHARARYVKVIAKSVMKCPSWHEAAGEPVWLFADEIIIE